MSREYKMQIVEVLDNPDDYEFPLFVLKPTAYAYPEDDWPKAKEKVRLIIVEDDS